jgi:hypothetical protein
MDAAVEAREVAGLVRAVFEEKVRLGVARGVHCAAFGPHVADGSVLGIRAREMSPDAAGGDGQAAAGDGGFMSFVE